MEGLKVWVTTLLSYDKYGKATVLKSFSSIAKTSDIKKGEKKVAHKAKVVSVDDAELW